MFQKLPSGFLNGFGAPRLLSPGTCCFKNAFLTKLSRLVLVKTGRLMGLTTSHCDLHSVALIRQCAINDPWCSEVLLKVNWVCIVKCSSWFPPDWIRRWYYDLVHPRWRSGAFVVSRLGYAATYCNLWELDMTENPLLVFCVLYLIRHLTILYCCFVLIALLWSLSFEVKLLSLINKLVVSSKYYQTGCVLCVSLAPRRHFLNLTIANCNDCEVKNTLCRWAVNEFCGVRGWQDNEIAPHRQDCFLISKMRCRPDFFHWILALNVIRWYSM